MDKFLTKYGTKIGAGLLTLGVLVSVVAPTSVGAVKVPDVSGDMNLVSDAGDLFTNVVNIVFVVAALITFFYLIMGAINWITSGGDKGKVEQARDKITAAVIGLLILAATWAIFNLVTTIAFGRKGDQLIIPSLKSGSTVAPSAPGKGYTY